MKIKKGDLVRVSGAAPKIYLSRCDGLYIAFSGVVIDIEGDHALIKSSVHVEPTAKLAIPTKYLVKVDAEAKEARYHEGEKVCYNGYVYEIKGLVGKNRYALKGLNFDLDEDMIEPYKPYTEPTEQTETEENPCVGRINFAERIKLQQEAHQAIVDEFRSRSFDWDAYTAGLAKELAISYAKRGKSPLDAVAAAKEITKRLKQK